MAYDDTAFYFYLSWTRLARGLFVLGFLGLLGLPELLWAQTGFGEGAEVGTRGAAPFSGDIMDIPDPFKSFELLEPRFCNQEEVDPDLLEILERQESLNEVSDDEFRQTLIHRAVQKQCIPLLRWLLKNGVDWKIRDQNRRNALDLAIQIGNSEILKVFLSHISQSSIDSVQSKAFVTWMTGPMGDPKNQSELAVKLGFTLSNVSERQVFVLNSALKGMYRLDQRTTLNGKTDFFFNRVNDEMTSVRYLVDTKVVREELFRTPWNGALKTKVEGYLSLTTFEIAGLIERSWKVYEETLQLGGSLGPGYRSVRIDEGGFYNDATITGQQTLLWKPKKDFLVFKGGKYSLEETTSFSVGESGITTILEASFKHRVFDDISMGVAYKIWRASVQDTEVDDSQILFEVTYETIR